MSKQTTEITKNRGSADSPTAAPDHRQIEALAYELWLQRGCPVGSDQEDWFRAEQELRRAGKAQRAA